MAGNGGIYRTVHGSGKMGTLGRSTWVRAACYGGPITSTPPVGSSRLLVPKIWCLGFKGDRDNCRDCPRGRVWLQEFAEETSNQNLERQDGHLSCTVMWLFLRAIRETSSPCVPALTRASSSIAAVVVASVSVSIRTFFVCCATFIVIVITL